MDLTPVQARTLETLIEPGASSDVAPGLHVRLQRRIEDELAAVDLPEDLWIFKRRLNQLAQCEGLGLADLLGEGDVFSHSEKTALGTLLHKVIELDVGSREDLDPHSLATLAVARLHEDEPFAAFWDELDPPAQDELLMEAVRVGDLFRSTFPPLRLFRRELSPQTELRLRADLLGGRLMLSGRPDLALGRVEPRATRLLIDLKSGDARAEYPEDLRFYALVHTIRFGVPPRRVASLFLDSGVSQSEDVTVETLDHAAGRMTDAVKRAARLLSGAEPKLSPGRYCHWCPRGETCPESLARLGG